MTDPRVEAASKACASGYESYPDPAKRSIHEEVLPILEAADAADRERRIYRVTVGYSTVMQLDSILRSPRKAHESLNGYHNRRMSEVIAALSLEES